MGRKKKTTIPVLFFKGKQVFSAGEIDAADFDEMSKALKPRGIRLKKSNFREVKKASTDMNYLENGKISPRVRRRYFNAVIIPKEIERRPTVDPDMAIPSRVNFR